MNESEPKIYKVISNICEGFYEEKKSKFIAVLAPVTSEQEALSFINSIKKKHYDARHNCYCFIIGPGKELVRSSDDKEPSGTAGKPMLEVLLGADITNVVAVVTRYFGGVLLGTGGLVRAYSEAVKDALLTASICEICYCVDFEIIIGYDLIDLVKRIIKDEQLTLLSDEYLEKVSFKLRSKIEEYPHIVSLLTELTQGRAVINKTGQGYYPI